MANLKSQRNKERTVALPHRVMNKVSISLAKMKRIDSKSFLGYEAVIPVKGGTMTIRSGADISPQDMRMFHFVLSQWEAMRKTISKDKELDELTVNLPLIIESLGWKNRTENRRKIIEHLERMINMTLTYSFESGKIMFSTLEYVKVLNHSIISIKISDTFEKAIAGKGLERFINVSRSMKLTSGYAMELFNLLQMDGLGVVNGDGAPLPAMSINHKRVCQFLHLEYGIKSSQDEVTRAFKALEKIDIPKYRIISVQGNKLWVQIGKNPSKKALDFNTQLVVKDTQLVVKDTQLEADTL